MSTWFANAGCVKIPVEVFDMDRVSFTYGDMFAVFNPQLDTGEEWWGQVYRYEEILRLIDRYGYPEHPQYNMYKGEFPKDKPIRDYLKYVEEPVWSRDVLEKFKVD